MKSRAKLRIIGSKLIVSFRDTLHEFFEACEVDTASLQKLHIYYITFSSLAFLNVVTVESWLVVVSIYINSIIVPSILDRYDGVSSHRK
jgi:hypothetical protein